MAMVFPGWDRGASAHVVRIVLDMPGMPRAARHGLLGKGENRALAEPRLVMRTDAAHLTLIASLVPADQDGRPAAAHVTPMGLAAYQFEQRQGAWTLSARQGVFALEGFFGDATLRAVALSARRDAVAVESGSCWQGYCTTLLALYELDKGQVRRVPAVATALSGINVNGAGDCARRLQPLVKPPQDERVPEADNGAGAGSHDCYAIDGTWKLLPAHEQPGDLVIHYHGALSRAGAHAGLEAIDQRQVLRYEGGRYRAVAGFNPVPPL